MATESVATQMNGIAAALDGLSGIMDSIIETDDWKYSHRAAYVAGELLSRLNDELGQLALQVGKMEGA